MKRNTEPRNTIVIEAGSAISTRTSRADGFYRNRATGAFAEVTTELTVPSDVYVILVDTNIRRIQCGNQSSNSKFNFKLQSVEELDAFIASLTLARKEAERFGTLAYDVPK